MTREALARRACAWIVVGLGLTIPVSTAADAVLLVLLVLGWLLAAPRSLHEARAALHLPVVIVALALVAALAIGCFYGDATPREAFSGLTKYLELALIPVIAWGASDEATRRRALICFGIAVVASLYVAYSAAAGLPGLRSPHYPIGFKASVTHNIVVSLGAFLFLLAARETADIRRRVGLLALAALCAHNVLFIVIGRTGYLILAVLFAYFIVATLRGWRGPVLAAVACAALLSGAYFAAPSFRDRVEEARTDLFRWESRSDSDTSVGHRIEYARNTLQIIAEHPFMGVGTGGFARAFAEQVKGTPVRATTNPHNDYLLIAAQIGLPGAALLVALYVTLWVSARRASSAFYRDLARGLVLTMAIAGLFNSALLDHTEGLLFAWMTALVCAASLRSSEVVRTGATA